ncbi:MAG: response regulator [Deltaproteobacteria bacterium]|nr:response regulator [Deltaproteobacteria bacterium]
MQEGLMPDNNQFARGLRRNRGRRIAAGLLAVAATLAGAGSGWPGEPLPAPATGNGVGLFFAWAGMICLLVSGAAMYLKQRRGKRVLEEELRRLVSLQEDNPHLLLETDLQGHITYASPACRRRFPAVGNDRPHPLLQGMAGRLPCLAEQQWVDFADDLDSGAGIFARQVQLRRPEGVIRISAVEVSRLRELEKDLQQAREEAEAASRLKNIFLANMGHEIRTPLNAILGYADLLMMDAANPVVRKRLAIISSSGKSLLALIDDILDIAKISAGKLEIMEDEFSIGRILDEFEQMFAQQAADKKIDFQVTTGGVIPDSTIGDSNRLKQILVNLLSNSFKFTETGAISLHCTYADGKAIFRVADTGIGISKEKQHDIFAEFQQADADATRRYGGTGLGLSITSRLVALMHGSMSLESDSGRGAVFTVYLPFREGASAGADHRPGKEVQVSGEMLTAALAAAGRSLRVLLAEDNDMNQYLIGEMLGNVGLHPVIAADGLEALARLAEADFDLLLLDMKMPVLDGMQTIARIRSQDRWRNLHVIALTGDALPGDREKFLAMGCNDYLAKPLDLATMYGKIYGLVTAGFTPADQDDAGAGQPVAPAAVNTRLEISRELRFQIVQAVDVLKNNLKIFNPDQIRGLAGSFADFDHLGEIRLLQQELQQIAMTFDDEALPQLIRKLEAL